jgi:hypothetical protein
MIAALWVPLAVAGCEGNHDVVTSAEFKKIRPGMTLDQVRATIGADGRRMSPSESIPGTLSVSSDRALFKDEVYVWINRDGSNASVQVSRGVAIAAAQSNL